MGRKKACERQFSPCRKVGRFFTSLALLITILLWNLDLVAEPKAVREKSSTASLAASYSTACTSLSTSLSFKTAPSSASIKPIPPPISTEEKVYGEKSASEYARNLFERGLVSSEIEERNWAGRAVGMGQDVEFDLAQKVPLEVLGLLGCSNVAQVHKVRCRRVLLARKSMKCNYKLTISNALNEVEHLQKLCHPHSIQLVGTYVQGRTFAILLYPVATHDLATFMDHVTLILASGAAVTETMDAGDYLTVFSLENFISCLSNALSYMHERGVKHMDIKPKNILVKQHDRYLYGHQVYIADFGISRSFPPQDHSQTESFTAKTPMYCAPEVYRGQKWGRAADVFSMGCVFLEIHTVLCGKTLDEFVEYRRGADSGSFHANLDVVSSWVDDLRSTMPYFVLNDDHLTLTEANDNINAVITDMLDDWRPRASDVARKLRTNDCCLKQREDFNAEEPSNVMSNSTAIPPRSPFGGSLPVGLAMDYIVQQAASNGREHLLQLLLANGGDVEARDSHNQTPLYQASLNGHFSTVSQLLNAGADVNATRSDGQTALHSAALHAHGEVVEHLLQKGAAIEVADSFGRTPLYKAAKAGHKNIVRLLLKFSSCEGVICDGRVELRKAVVKGHEAIVRLLLEKTEASLTSIDGRFALDLAASSRHKEIRQALLNAGMNIDSLDNDGQAALHKAALGGDVDLVSFLLANGACDTMDNIAGVREDFIFLKTAEMLGLRSYFWRVLWRGNGRPLESGVAPCDDLGRQ